MRVNKIMIISLVLLAGLAIIIFLFWKYQLYNNIISNTSSSTFVISTTTSATPNNSTSTVDQSVPCPETYRAVAGLIINLTDENGNYISGATIKSGGQDKNFEEQINYQPGMYEGLYKAGEYSFTIKKYGYQDYAGTIKLLDGECHVVRQEKNISLKRVLKSDEFTYLISNEDISQYCNNTSMKSDDYRKTINNVKISSTSKDITKLDELVKVVLDKSTTNICHTIMTKIKPVILSGTANVIIPKVSDYAGKTIVDCGCVPQVEVNLLRIKGIDKVVWVK